jgi:ATP-binding cassette subfamily B protein
MTPESAVDPGRWLRRIPALRDLGDQQIDELTALCELRIGKKGAPVAQAPWRGAGIVLAGSVRVVEERNGESFPIASVPAGGAFAGESLLNGATASYAVYATSDCTVALLEKRVWDGWLAAHASATRQIQESTGEAPAVEETGDSGEEAAKPEEAARADSAELRWQSPEYRPRRRRFFGRYPVVRQQSSMDCGAACLASICLNYGRRVSLNRLRELARVGTTGASLLHIMRAAQEIGFETIPMLATLEHLQANHLPAIVNWKGYHWLVVYRLDVVGGVVRHVLVGDPGGGLNRMPVEEFQQGWTRYTLYLRPTPAFAALAESPRTLKQFTPYLRPFRATLWEIGLASLTMQLLALLTPAFTRFVIDDVIVAQQTQWLNAALIGLAVAAVLQLAAARSRQRLLLMVSQRVNQRLIRDFYRHVMSLPLPYFERRKTGDVVSRLEENSKLTAFFTNTGVEVGIDALMALLYFALMLHYNARLTLVCAAFLCLHIVNISVVTPRLRQGFRLVFQTGAELHSHTIESLHGLATIRVLGIDRYIRWTWENLFARLANAHFTTLKYSIASGLASQISTVAGEVAVLFYGAALVMENHLTVGGLVAFTVLYGSLTGPLARLVGAWERVQEALNSVERLNDVYESAPESPDEPGDGASGSTLVVLPRLSGHIRLEEVTFRYDPESRNVLQNVSLEIHMGQRVAFVGRSGSGKSTLAKLLLGFYAPTSGRILVDGFDLSRVWLPSLRRQIGVVPQESFLFRGTIRDNIVEAKPDAAPAEVEWAARLADAHGFIARTPLGYETMLDENAANLSGGQRQRIAIARVLVQQPRMLVLDEATSALDNESERRIMRDLDESFSSLTTILIAHRLSTVRNADLIVVLDHGNIVEQGTHDQLMQRRGLYYVLSTQQLNL